MKYTYRLNTYQNSYLSSYLSDGIEHGQTDISIPTDWNPQKIAKHLGIDMENIRSIRSKYGRDVIVFRTYKGNDFELRRYEAGKPSSYLKLIVSNGSVQIDTFKEQWNIGSSCQDNAKRHRERQNDQVKRAYRVNRY